MELHLFNKQYQVSVSLRVVSVSLPYIGVIDTDTMIPNDTVMIPKMILKVIPNRKEETSYPPSMCRNFPGGIKGVRFL
jgi:hypothetical protein